MKFMTAIVSIFLMTTPASSQSLHEKWTNASSFSVEELSKNELFSQAVKEGRKGIGHMNKFINLSIKPIDEKVDYWATPIETLSSRSGDCEDYAILKMAVLEELGIDSTIIVVRHYSGSYHVVLQVGNVILDNRSHSLKKNIDVGYEMIISFTRKN